MYNSVVLIPSLEPDQHLVEVVEGCLEEGLRDIVVIDDGSSPACRAIFDRAEALGAVVVRHSVNRGKGAALKTGLRAALERFPRLAGVVTADGDGQHLPADIRRVAETMEAGDLLTFELLSIYEDGDTAERGYHLFDIALEQVTGAVTLTPETESPFSQVRLTPMTLSLTAPIPGDGAEALDQSLDVPEVVLTYKDGGTETILDGTLAKTPFGQRDIANGRGKRPVRDNGFQDHVACARAFYAMRFARAQQAALSLLQPDALSVP